MLKTFTANPDNTCFELPITKNFNITRLARMVYLEDTRFILVRAEYPYVQFVAAARVTSTESF